MNNEVLTGLVIFIFGLCFGSFLNVMIWRLPRDESIVFPPSHCPKCNTKIKPYDNLPIISWIILMGRCRYCSTPISVRYPLIELFTASLFVLEYYIYINSHTFSLEIVPLLAFVGILFGQAVIDFETQLLPFGASLSGMAIGLIYAFLRKPWWEFFIAAAAGFIIIGAIGLIGKIIYKKDAMGGGDLVFAAFLGSFLGIQNLIIGLFFGIMLSGLFAIGLLLFTEKTRKDEFALGPFLALGGFLAQPELGLGELTKRLFGF